MDVCLERKPLISDVIKAKRANMDKQKMNKNGSRLIDLCKSMKFNILNGRTKSDLDGNLTCFKGNNGSTIDYAVVSDSFLPYVVDFRIDCYDACYSDVHAPICLSVSSIESDKVPGDVYIAENSVGECEVDETTGKDYIQVDDLKFNWSKDEKDVYIETVYNSDVSLLKDRLSNLKGDINKANVDSFCDILKDFMIDTAKEAGALKEKNKKKKRTIATILKEGRDIRPWMDEDCFKLRNEYYKAKNKLKRNNENKSASNKLCKDYKKKLARVKKEYYKDVKCHLRNLKSNNSRDYWNYINNASRKKQETDSIPLPRLANYFKHLSDSAVNDDNHDTMHDDNDNTKYDDFTYLLNNKITIDELNNVLLTLKNGKACGIDQIRNEFLKNLSDDVKCIIVDFFNIVLESGFIPNEWGIGVIFPIYKKKGDTSDPNNYRGITLLSCFSKLFTALLNTRVTAFLETTKQLGIEQAGFRPGYSTIDHIFTLFSIIQLYLRNGKKLYCAFVDYKKAFDLVDRTSLWSKLLKVGIKGPFFNIIRNMYSQIKSCVKDNNGNISSFFACKLGVRQGENLSPILFSLYLNDFNEFLSGHYTGLSFMCDEVSKHLKIYLNLFCLLYADDTILLAESPEELQLALNGLYEYCNKWSLSVNLDKTKIVIFSKSKKNLDELKYFLYNDKVVEIVDEYVYLGVTFKGLNCNFDKAIEKQLGQARAAMFALLEKARYLRLPIDICLDLFEKCVVPILLYGSEVWGYSNCDSIEVFHRSFLKILLKVYKFTPNVCVYGELGQFDLRNKINVRMISYWAKLKYCDTRKFSKCMLELSMYNSSLKSCPWSTKINSLLDNYGFSYVHLIPVTNETTKFANSFINAFKTRVSDVSNQEWWSNVVSNSQCSFYEKIKIKNCFEDYIKCLDGKYLYNMIRFRTRCHRLPITNNRFCKNNVNISTTCKLCSMNEIGDEMHYLFKCPFFANARKVFSDHFSNAPLNPNDVSQIFQSNCPVLLKALCTFITVILKEFDDVSVDDNFKPIQTKIQVTRAGRTIRMPFKFKNCFV